MFHRNEIYIRRMKYEEAELELKKEIDRLYMEDVSSVRIVHGKGKGVLKKMVQDYLLEQPFVDIIHDGSFFEGGAGVTIVKFKNC